MTKQENPSTAKAARLFGVAGRENVAIRRLDGRMAELHEVWTAKTALQRFTAAQLRAAWPDHHRAWGGGRVS